MIKLLDCTLRDGGYINNWNFGAEAIVDMKNKLEESNIDIIELGFIKNEPQNKDRTVFNNMEDVKRLIGKKQSNKQYAVMAEVINPLPLDMLAPYDEESPEIIRVIVWKRMLKEGFEYCKGIVEKGYKLCVQPARVSQYSDEEFIEMLEMFKTLNPMAIYIVDSWGTMYKDELLHYMKLADDNLNPEIAIGYHGHNNLMQAFGVACAFCSQNLQRDILIDASIYGIGRGAGNLNTELFIKYANEKLNKNYNLSPIVSIYDKYISKIYLKEKWGYSFSYEITAKYNANPDFAKYFEKEGVSNEIIEKAIAYLAPEERIIYNENKAKELLRNINKNEFKKKIVIVVVTANRPNDIKGYLIQTANELYDLGTDLVIFDSSNDNSTENITNLYSKEYDNVLYDRWNGKYDGVSIDNKVIDAYKKYSELYEYVWLIRDGLTVNPKFITDKLKEYINKKYDLIVVDHYCRDVNKYGSKKYKNSIELFTEQCVNMNTLGLFILRNEFIKNLIKEIPLDDKTYGMYCPIAFFHYFSNHEINAASCIDEPFIFNSFAKDTSFWTKKVLWQWGQRWYELINNLPEVYDEYKAQVLKVKTSDFEPFSRKILLKAKNNNGLSLSLVNKYKKYLPYVTDTPLHIFYLFAITPKFLANKLCRILSNTGRYNKKDNRNHIKNDVKIDYENYENRIDLYDDIKSNLLFGSQDKVNNPFITIFIPTYKRLDLFKEALQSALNQFLVDFEWNIIVVDNEPYDGRQNETEKYIRQLNNDKITYYRNDKNLKPGDNFNRGIYLAKAPWVMMLHDDDILLPFALEKMYNSIKFLSKQKGKKLGAISVDNYQFKYDPKKPKEHCQELEKVYSQLTNSPLTYKFVKLTHANVLCTGHPGGNVPTCGATYNKEAFIKTGGFNDDFGISADIILYYCMANNYSVYHSFGEYGFYRWGVNQMSEFNNTHKTIADNAKFREYIFSKNILTRLYGFLFRNSMYYLFTKSVLNTRKVVTHEKTEFSDYSDICNVHPNPIMYAIFKHIIFKGYNKRKKAEMKKLAKAYRKSNN